MKSGYELGQARENVRLIELEIKSEQSKLQLQDQTILERNQILRDKEMQLAQETSQFQQEEELIDEKIAAAEREIHEMKQRIIAME